MRAGALREIVRLEQSVVEPNDLGEEIATWIPYGASAIPASAIPVSGSETWSAQATRGEAIVRFRIRYLSGVSTKMRLVWGERTFDLLAAQDPTGRRSELELIGRELL